MIVAFSLVLTATISIAGCLGARRRSTSREGNSCGMNTALQANTNTISYCIKYNLMLFRQIRPRKLQVAQGWQDDEENDNDDDLDDNDYDNRYDDFSEAPAI